MNGEEYPYLVYATVVGSRRGHTPSQCVDIPEPNRGQYVTYLDKPQGDEQRRLSTSGQSRNQNPALVSRKSYTSSIDKDTSLLVRVDLAIPNRLRSRHRLLLSTRYNNLDTDAKSGPFHEISTSHSHASLTTPRLTRQT
jgi:hypothetical protein